MNLETIGIDKETVLNMLVDKLADDVDVYSMGVRDLVQARIKKKIHEDVDGIIDSTLKETIDSILEKPITPIDSWGEPKGEPRTLKEMIKTRAETYLSEKVNSEGRADTYNAKSSRLDGATSCCEKWELKQ